MKMMRPLAFLAALVFAVMDAAAARPNVVIIFVDDLGYADIGPFGATKQKTPNLDRMAAEGMKLTSFYAAPVCSVSRAQLLTGCYGPRISVPSVYFPGEANGLNPAEITIAERLREQGYATACIGKWHVGDQPEFLPTKQGFDRYFGIPYSNDMQHKAAGGTARVTPLLRDDSVAELLTDAEQSRIVERYTEEAIRFMRESQQGPFFLYFAHTAVHTPIYPGAAFRGKSANGRFGDWVEEVDWSVGRVLETLRELHLDEKTLVIFTSDNGPWLLKGSDGGSALPLRGGKGSTWEGGVRVPTLARWPGRITPGSVCDAVAGTIDLLPTAVALAGGSIPAEPVIDGRDISPLLFGTSTASPREAHYYFSGYALQAVRQGPWKLAIASPREPVWNNVAPDARTNPRLYNLDAEIAEKTNVAADHPEIVAKLQTLAAKMSAEIGGEKPTARRPAGEVANPSTLYPIEETKAAKPVPTPANLTDIKPGDVFPAEASPQIGGKPFSLSCVVNTTQQSGVILAHGGTAMGYALHLQSGKVVFTIRAKAGVAHVEAPFPASSGAHRILASLMNDGWLTLQVGDQPLVRAPGVGLIPNQPQEDFCIGHDNKNSVTTYASSQLFQGHITDLKISPTNPTPLP